MEDTLQKKSPRKRGLGLKRRSGLGHVCGQWALGALADLEFDFLSFVESPEAFSFNVGEVDEDIIPGLLLDETISLGLVEPLYFTAQNCPLDKTKTEREDGLPLSNLAQFPD
jgi:hypothetical protein